MALAIAIAQNQIAELEAKGPPPVGTKAGAIERNRTDFYWQTQVSDLQLPLAPYDKLGQTTSADQGRIHKVVVTVRWDRGLGRKNVSLSTILCDRRIP